jgi:hypothetical protein
MCASRDPRRTLVNDCNGHFHQWGWMQQTPPNVAIVTSFGPCNLASFKVFTEEVN